MFWQLFGCRGPSVSIKFSMSSLHSTQTLWRMQPTIMSLQMSSGECSGISLRRRNRPFKCPIARSTVCLSPENFLLKRFCKGVIFPTVLKGVISQFLKVYALSANICWPWLNNSPCSALWYNCELRNTRASWVQPGHPVYALMMVRSLSTTIWKKEYP